MERKKATAAGTSVTHPLRHSLYPQRYFYIFSICSMIWELGFTETVMPLNCFDEIDNSRA